MTTIATPSSGDPPRNFPSGIALVAAAEMILIALLLLLSNSPGFYAAAIACCICSIQLGTLLIARFRVNTLSIRRLAAQAEFSTSMVFITDAEGRIKWTNPCFNRTTGFNLSAIVGQTFSMVLHGQDTDTPTVEKIRKKIRAAQPFECHIMQYDRAGRAYWVSTNGQPISDSRAQVTHYIITQVDVSNQHRPTPVSNADAQFVTTAIGDGIEIVRRLAVLDAADNRAQLETLITGLKDEFDKAVMELPFQSKPSNTVHTNE